MDWLIKKEEENRKAIIWLLVFVADSWGGLPENVGPNTLRSACAVRVFHLGLVETDKGDGWFSLTSQSTKSSGTTPQSRPSMGQDDSSSYSEAHSSLSETLTDRDSSHYSEGPLSAVHVLEPKGEG